jgi:hypothetical protein
MQYAVTFERGFVDCKLHLLNFFNTQLVIKLNYIAITDFHIFHLAVASLDVSW